MWGVSGLSVGAIIYQRQYMNTQVQGSSQLLHPFLNFLLLKTPKIYMCTDLPCVNNFSPSLLHLFLFLPFQRLSSVSDPTIVNFFPVA